MAQAAEDRLEERVDLVELVRAFVQLVVHRLELFVGGLELLVHRLELLVRRLDLLVRRLELLVRRLKLLVRRLELLRRGLQFLVGGLERLLRPLDRVAQRPEPGHVVERDAGADRRPVHSDEGGHLHVEPVQLAADRPLDLADDHRVVLRLHGLDLRPQLDRPVRELEILERPPDVRGCEVEQLAGLRVREREHARAVDHDLRNRRRLERCVPQQRVLGHALRPRRALAGLHHLVQPLADARDRAPSRRRGASARPGRRGASASAASPSGRGTGSRPG